MTFQKFGPVSQWFKWLELPLPWVAWAEMDLNWNLFVMASIWYLEICEAKPGTKVTSLETWIAEKIKAILNFLGKYKGLIWSGQTHFGTFLWTISMSLRLIKHVSIVLAAFSEHLYQVTSGTVKGLDLLTLLSPEHCSTKYWLCGSF